MMGLFPIVGGAATPVSPGPYRFLRCTITTFQGTNQGCAAAHLRFKVGEDEHPETPLTSNTTPSPYVASASDEFNISYAAWKAFDNNSSTDPSAFAWFTGVRSPPAWIQIDLGAGNEIEPTGMVLAINDPTHGWAAFEVEGSNTGAFSGEQTQLYSTSGVIWSANESKTFNF